MQDNHPNVSVLTDLTPEKILLLKERAEQAELTLENVVAIMPGHVYWKDKEGHYLGCNDYAAHCMGFKHAHEMIGKTDFDFPVPPGAAENYRKNDLRIMQRGVTELVEELTVMDGKETIILSHKAPLRNKEGEVTGIIGVSIDIEELKAAAKSADQLKKEFIHNMEHDIRTPLTGMYGIANILANDEPDNKKQALLNDIANCAKELLNYNSDILDFSHISSGALFVSAKKFAIRKLLDEVLTMETLPAKIKQLNFSITCDENVPHVIIGDRYRLQRILINLLSNAIKFTQHGFVRLRVERAKQANPRHVTLCFILEDSGVGIPADKLDVIYEKFSRLTPANRGVYEGLGLGLSIIKQFVNELDGDIDVKSVVGQGTTFTCTFAFKLPLLDIVDDFIE